MKTRFIALMAGALLLATAAPAGADHAFSVTATGTAFKLALAGQELTLGFTDAGAQSAASDACSQTVAVACAAAAAAIEPFGTTVRVHAPGQEGPEQSTALTIPEPLSQVVAADVAAARAVARGLPEPRGLANAGEAQVDLTLTQTLVENVPQTQETLQGISDQLLGTVEDTDPTGEVGGRIRGTIDAIIDDLDSAPLATVTVGPSSSETVDANGVSSAVAAAQGAVVTVAPTPQQVLPAAPEALIILEVGAAKATATSDQLTGTADFDPALARLRVFNPTANAYDEVEVAPGQGEQCAGVTPLVLCVTAGGGSVTRDGAAAAATASGVAVRLFEDPLPEVSLQLAVAEAGVNAAPPAVQPPPGPA
ncbi:MAG TPA: hypothetical protein VG452_06455, partial [Egibacteraceae bacterium]|nr:hypothetical protein [Egibacteraceae bacterium]